MGTEGGCVFYSQLLQGLPGISDLCSDGIIWKSGVYREKAETGIFLEAGICSPL